MAEEVRISHASAGTLANALRQRQVSSLELTDAYIARIERLDTSIHAVVVRDFDRARDAAKVADIALGRGEDGSLLGVPMTVKEAHNISGLPTTWGNPAFEGWIAKTDSVAVARLKAAGAVILGKTNIATDLSDWQSYNPMYGRTNNPWDLSRTAGGSSGGSAAALAARMVPLELGSDFAGSIRVPAAFCGVFGHKSSYGLVSTCGFGPFDEERAEMPMAVIGPMAHTASDLALALSVLAGPDNAEAIGYYLRLPAPRHARLADYRVMILDQHPQAATDTEIQTALHQLGDRMEAMGACVERSNNLLPQLNEAHKCFSDIVSVVKSRRGAFGANPISTPAWMKVLDAQVAIRRHWADVFSSFDVVLAPAFGTTAFRHDDKADRKDRTISINGEETSYGAQSAWPSIASAANLPSTVAPIDRTALGLPIGIQIIGPYLEDRTTIEFAGLLEREFGAAQAPDDKR